MLYVLFNVSTCVVPEARDVVLPNCCVPFLVDLAESDECKNSPSQDHGIAITGRSVLSGGLPKSESFEKKPFGFIYIH